MAKAPEKTPETPLKRAFREARRGFIAIAVFSFFINMLMLVSPIYMMQVFDRVLSSGRTETLLYLTIIAGFALAVLGALEALRGRVLIGISTWLDRQLSGTLIASSVSGSLQGLSVGAQPLRDLAQIRGFINSNGIYALFDAPWTPIFIAVIWIMHPWLGMLALGAALVLFALALANELITRTPLKEASQIQIRAQQQAEATTRNAQVVQAMGLLPGLLRRWNLQNAEVLDRQQTASKRAGTIVGFSKFFRLAVQVGILGLGAFLVLGGELTSGGMIAGSILLGRALAPVEQAIGAWKSLIGAQAGYGRLKMLLERIPPQPPRMPLPAPEGHLTVDRLTFAPPGSNRPVLKQVSFELTAGEALGVIGPSAAGKSTLCRLLVGGWPPSTGHVRLDAAEVHTWDPVDLGRHVGYLPQDVELFSGTVRDNIARMVEDPPPAAVIEAASLAGVHEMILHLPDGYDTEIGDFGAVLSGGQRQRIGLARALYDNPRLLVLDEPNANLDQDGEIALLKAIQMVKERGTTVIMVAHRPSVLAHVDKLLVLREGVVEMFGKRDDILSRLRRPDGKAQPQVQGQAKPQVQAPEQPRQPALSTRFVQAPG